MKKTNRGSYIVPFLMLVGVVVVLLVLIRQSPAAGTGTTDSPNSVPVGDAAVNCSDPLKQPDPEKRAAERPDEFSWVLFLYLNCPVQSSQPSPLIWETWKPDYAVYLPDGKQPAPWGSPLPPRVLSAAPEISGLSLKDKAGQPILYEIRMNESTFNYIVARELYSKAGQLKFFSDPAARPIEFDPDAIEIKAAWIVLGPDDIASRYYTIDTKEYGLVGLAGFHITSKVLKNWVWATFEQRDNEAMTGVPQRVETPQSVRDLNKKIHAALPANSPWQYYDLRGTQIAFLDADNQPSLLANTLIETDFQKSSSCITCHALASVGDAAQGYLGFFNTSNGIEGYTGKITDPKNKYYDAYDDPVCYESQKGFVACGNHDKVVYKLTDFVWSLIKAQ
jgi:hypothetical protein